MPDPLFPGEPPLATLALAPLGIDPPAFPPQDDALADPALDDVAQSFLGLLPPGAAWRTPDGTAFEGGMLGRFWRGIADDFATVYRRIFRITQQSTAATVSEGLVDWEAEYGLPDPCLGENPSVERRLASLQLKVRSPGTLTKRDFIALAASVGYVVTIAEPQSFECGMSDCGGEDGLGGPVDFVWIVTVRGEPVFRFECGVSECGVHALTDFAAATDLECLFRRLAPAWTRPVFAYQS